MATAHQLKITLKGVKPPVWRRLVVPSDVTLAELREVLIAGMGWSGYHLASFTVGRTTYLEPDDDWPSSDVDPASVRLRDVAGAGDGFTFDYDFGDGWKHAVVVEEVLPVAGRTRPSCVAGRRACPPEDVGGPWGYGDFLDAIADPGHDRHDELLEWIGGGFDPEAFDVAETDEALKLWAGRSD